MQNFFFFPFVRRFDGSFSLIVLSGAGVGESCIGCLRQSARGTAYTTAAEMGLDDEASELELGGAWDTLLDGFCRFLWCSSARYSKTAATVTIAPVLLPHPPARSGSPRRRSGTA